MVQKSPNSQPPTVLDGAFEPTLAAGVLNLHHLDGSENNGLQTSNLDPKWRDFGGSKPLGSAVFIQNFSHENQQALNGLNAFWGDEQAKVTKFHPLYSWRSPENPPPKKKKKGHVNSSSQKGHQQNCQVACFFRKKNGRFSEKKKTPWWKI